MPVLNQSTDSFGKYSLFVSDSYAGTYKRCPRVVIQNFRTQMRGLGSCGIIILPKDQVNEKFEVELKIGQFCKILDTSIFFEEEYTSVGDELFFGTITSMTTDIFAEIQDDKGFATIDEIGQFYSKKPIIWNSKPQVFNPIVSGVCYGNKFANGDQNIFETNIVNMAKAKLDGTNKGKFTSDSTGTAAAGNTRVWSLEDFLRYMADLHGIEVLFPWEFDAKLAQKLGIELNPAQEKLYKFFKDTIDIKSFNHYDGKSFQELLQDVVNEPFDWFFTSESTSGITVQIINKAPVAALDWCPSAVLVQKTLDPLTTTNFNITKQDEVYGKITYRGNNILVAGTLGNWNCNNSASMDKGWTTEEEQEYIDAEDNTDVAVASSIRSHNKKVYQQYVYKHLEESCPIQIPKKLKATTPFNYEQAPLYPTGDGQAFYEMGAFFPRIDFVEYNNNSVFVLAKPTVYNSLGVHKTPPLLELTWSSTLPWIVDKQKDMRKPFLVATTLIEDGSDEGWLFTYDLSKPGGSYETMNFKHTVDGYQIEMTIPETLAYYNEDLFKCAGVVTDAPDTLWESADASARNPAGTGEYKFMTNWKLLAATVAGYSDQRLEWSIDNPDTTVARDKTKIIEDKSLECWFVHGGTIKEIYNVPDGVQKETGRRYKLGYDRWQTDTFIKNDFKKVYDLARQTSNWLFLPKASAKIELALMNYDNTVWKLGEVIKEVVDKTIIRTINTCVYSVEYDLVSNRLNVSTSIPEMPIFKKLQNTPMSKSAIAPSSDSKESTIQVKEKVITKEEYPTHGLVTGGSGGGVSQQKSDICYLIGGNELAYLGEGLGIMHLSTKLETVSVGISASLGLPSILPNGLGWAKSIDTNQYVLVINDKRSLCQYDLISNQHVFAGANVNITGAAGVVYPARLVAGPI